jgi:hypothetical protein
MPALIQFNAHLRNFLSITLQTSPITIQMHSISEEVMNDKAMIAMIPNSVIVMLNPFGLFYFAVAFYRPFRFSATPLLLGSKIISTFVFLVSRSPTVDTLAEFVSRFDRQSLVALLRHPFRQAGSLFPGLLFVSIKPVRVPRDCLSPDVVACHCFVPGWCCIE